MALEQRGELVEVDQRFVVGTHQAISSMAGDDTTGEKPRSVSVLARRFRASCRLDLTVPREQPSASAVSASLSPT